MYKDWYKDCGDAIRAEFGQDADLFIDLLAATSPRRSIVANWRLAMRVYHMWNNKNIPIIELFKPIDLENLLHSVMKSHRPNVIRALKRQPLSGKKVFAFAANLKGDLNAVTIDVWVTRYFGIKKLTNKKYNGLTNLIRYVAKEKGLKPAEYQAIIWGKAQKQAGKNPKSFLQVPNRKQMFFEFYWS